MMSALHGLMRLGWFVRRPQARGAHALVLTDAGKIVLVRLRYARGWRLPGGGIAAGEEMQEGLLRELREEIGLTSHGPVEFAFEEDQVINHKSDRSHIFIVRGATYDPLWSLEIEEIAEFNPDALPPGLPPRTARWLAKLLPVAGQKSAKARIS